MGAIFPLLGLAGIVFFIYRLFQNKKKLMKMKEELFKVFAKTNHLNHSANMEMTVSMNHVNGNIEGHPFILQDKRSGKHFSSEALFQNTPFDFTFSITKKGFVNMGMSAGKMKYETGNPDFDKVFKIHTDDQKKIESILTPETQNELLKISPAFLGAMLHHPGALTYTFTGSLIGKKDWDRYLQVHTYLLSFIAQD